MRLPRQRVWPIFPGVRSFLNCGRGFSDMIGGGKSGISPLLVCPELCLGCGDPLLRGRVGTSWQLMRKGSRFQKGYCEGKEVHRFLFIQGTPSKLVVL